MRTQWNAIVTRINTPAYYISTSLILSLNVFANVVMLPQPDTVQIRRADILEDEQLNDVDKSMEHLFVCPVNSDGHVKTGHAFTESWSNIYVQHLDPRPERQIELLVMATE